MTAVIASRKIEGKHHPIVKKIRAMARSGELLAEGQVLLETPHLIAEALSSSSIQTAIVSSDAPEAALALVRRLPAGTELYEVPAQLFRQLTSTESHRGIVALAEAPTWEEQHVFNSAARAALLILAGVQDAGNVGTILRAAEALGATGIVLAEGTASPYNGKCVRGSAGAIFRMPVIQMAAHDIWERLSACGIALWCAAARSGKTVADSDLAQPAAIALGSEGGGLPPEWLRRGTPVSIPMSAGMESLNVAVAASIFLYEMARQRGFEFGGGRAAAAEARQSSRTAPAPKRR